MKTIKKKSSIFDDYLKLITLCRLKLLTIHKHGKNNDNMVRLRYLNILVIIEDEGKKITCIYYMIRTIKFDCKKYNNGSIAQKYILLFR